MVPRGGLSAMIDNINVNNHLGLCLSSAVYHPFVPMSMIAAFIYRSPALLRRVYV